MRVCLINPSPRIWIKSATLPLGIAYIASILLRKNHEVSIFDENYDSELPEADLYGITATTPLVGAACRIAGQIKKRSGAYTVMGGPHSTCLPDEVLRHPDVDFIIRGEGEYTLAELIEALESKKELSSIKGLSYKAGSQRIHNPDRPFITDLDLLPFPAYDLFKDITRYSHPQPLIGWRKPVLNIITSRGCPFDCVFCYKGTFGTQWRARGAENVVNEIEYIISRYGLAEYAVQDDAFNIDINRAKAICRLLIKRRIRTPWSLPNGMRADLVDEELLGLMKEAGAYRIAIGVESGNQEVLDDLGKRLRLERVLDTFRLLRKYRFQTIAFFVMGNPRDTTATLNDSIRFALKIRPTFAQFTMATPFPGTRLYDVIKKEGKLYLSDWEEYSQFDQKNYFDYTHLSGKIISQYVNKAYFHFYFNARTILRILMTGDFYHKIPYYFSALIHFIIKGK